jgi:putative endopeptidase
MVNFTKKKYKYKKKHTNTIKEHTRCIKDSDVQQLCETGQYSKYTDHFYNKENINKFNIFVKNVDKKSKRYKRYKIPMEKRTRFMVDKFKYVNKHIDEINYAKKNDFYNLVNEQWINSNDIEKNPKYYSKYDDFRVVQEDVYYKLIEYVKTYIRDNIHGHNAELALALKNVYSSMITKTPKKLQFHCKNILKEVERFMTETVYDILVDLNKNEIISWGAPISWSLLPDEKNVKKYISHLSCGPLSIYDYSIYDEPNSFIKREFIKCIREIFDVCLGKNHGFNPHDVWDVEVELLHAMDCNKVKKDDPDGYNIATSDELEHKYMFNWREFARKLGYKDIPRKVVVDNLSSLTCTMELLNKNWNTSKWKTYWLYIHYRQIIRFDKQWRHIYFNFFRKLLKGQQAEMPEEIYPIFTLSMCFNTFLTNQYVEHNYNELYVKYTKHLCDDLQKLFIHKLERNTWLSPSTKKTAINKLEKLKAVVGSPDKLRADALLKYADDDPWYNMRLLTNWKFKKYINLEGEDIIDIPEIDWQDFSLVGTQAYIVNAYYTPTSNSIYLPLAYLQPPFIDLKERGIEYNLAFIGYTIAHELSHCLDDSGSRYDEDGNLNNWWTNSDRKEFDVKIKDVSRQYKLAAARDGIDLDSDIAIGEDLADISGMALIEEYMRDYLVVNNTTDIIKHINLEKLYIYFAIQGRQKILKKALKSELKTNPHPLEKYRVNCCLARLEIFKTIYNIKKGDGMWWHNNDVIW